MTFQAIVGVFVKLLVLLTPFFVLSVFVSITSQYSRKERERIAHRTTVAIYGISLLIYFFGERIFQYLGITLSAFQAGAGVLLMLSGIELVRGLPASTNGIRKAEISGDISVVPLAIPYTVGPGSAGTLIVMGASAATWQVRIVEVCGLTLAVLVVGVLLHFAGVLENKLGSKGLNILTKLTGLFLAALAAQLILGALASYMSRP